MTARQIKRRKYGPQARRRARINKWFNALMSMSGVTCGVARLAHQASISTIKHPTVPEMEKVA